MPEFRLLLRIFPYAQNQNPKLSFLFISPSKFPEKQNFFHPSQNMLGDS